MFGFLRPKPKAQAPETLRRIPRKQLVAIMSGARAAMRELQEFAKRAKSRPDDRPIARDDLLDLLRGLAALQKQIDHQMDSEIAKSTDISDTEDRRLHGRGFRQRRQRREIAVRTGTSRNGCRNCPL